ncbi:hypothetical protein MPH_08434 [Macrophomina phaseolina MS6]|uniref:Uncharacterized protein n=2 Tax=Macrophomina phaseolina TaxID=35725 RepID=K2RW81_MACPH|nr:hypothetical protein MPH_08434 [Macrophomina phaseolina MS6]KAH7015949.1 hypothetical protein B0J12DRAFT_705760 [Macrophomina phaseolina]
MHLSAATVALGAALVMQLGLGAAAPVQDVHLEKRKSWRHCACQVSSHGIIDYVSTALVAQYNSWRWHLEDFPKIAGKEGAHYTGVYIVANSGKIDGSAFHKECLLNGGADSTCF